ncbi:ABC transporter permease [Labrenzia sp. CE80]|uniref:ABC transporter permease n=1 Tax=Labrenzia sp. CE80 TaxID=1788986 RepID=UPI00129B16E9|nr:ABC transporter permease [Labrenzia sp. CE80]
MKWLTASRYVVLPVASVGASWIAVVAVSFLLIRLIPGDPVEIFINHMNVRTTDELIAAYRAEWGLDRSLVVQFAIWLEGFVSLDWGKSFVTGQAVTAELFPRAGWSAAIGFSGMASAILIGYGLGFLAALKPAGVAACLSRLFAIGGQALPAFAVGLIVLWVLAAELQWIRPFSGGVVERLLLPIALVAFFSIGSVSRLVLVGFCEVLNAPYMRTALAKGLGRGEALWRHGRRHAVIVLLAGIAPDLAWVIGGTAVAEIVFGVPGLSERIVAAVAERDYPVLQPYIALVAIWLVVGLRLTAILRRSLDPRIDLSLEVGHR